jgi:hypothetical protein
VVIKLEKVPGMAVGISLMNRSSGGGVKIADVSPGSPLAPYVSKGDVLVSINGQACEQGHERAGDMLRASTGIIEIVFRAKTGSMLGSSKKSKIATAFRKGVNATIFIGADGRRRDERDGLTVPAASVGMPPKRATSPPARSASPRSSRPQTPQQTGTPTGTISAHLEADVQFRSTGASGRPKLRLPTATVLVEEPTATAPTKDMHKELKDFKGSTTPKELKGHLLSSTTPSEADEEQLGPGEYVVVLRRNDTTSIGLRLVQKRYDDLPTVLDIDKVRTLRHSNLRGCPVPTGLPPYCRLAAAAPPPLLPAAAPRFPVLFPCYSRADCLRARVWSHVSCAVRTGRRPKPRSKLATSCLPSLVSIRATRSKRSREPSAHPRRRSCSSFDAPAPPSIRPRRIRTRRWEIRASSSRTAVGYSQEASRTPRRRSPFENRGLSDVHIHRTELTSQVHMRCALSRAQATRSSLDRRTDMIVHTDKGGCAPGFWGGTHETLDENKAR